MARTQKSLITVGIGDIHGRFHRVSQWIGDLEQALGRRVDFVFAVGDVEAFQEADNPGRKSTKRGMPAEFADYVQGRSKLPRPLHFIGGNNEDFAQLFSMPQGGHLGAQLHYLGRAGAAELEGLRVVFLSGIYAPTYYAKELLQPNTQERRKQAGYFREPEVERLLQVKDADLMLVHEWPRSLIKKRAADEPPLRADRFPWIGNAITRGLLERIRPQWLWCGHSHVPLASTWEHEDGTCTRIACLDQAVRPEDSVFWIEWEDRKAVRAGWGTGGAAAWQADAHWGRANTPS